MGVNQIIIGLIALLGLYLLWLALRYVQLGRRRAALREPLHFSEPDLRDAPQEKDDAFIALDPPTEMGDTRGLFDETDPESPPAAIRRTPRPPAEPDAGAFGFDALLEMRQLRHQVDELRSRLDAQSAEVVRLSGLIDDMRSAARVSPQYGEAVALARRGHDAAAIAERCGISVSEAELVLALAAVNDTEGGKS